VEGSWKDLGDSLNQLLRNIADQVLEINRIVTAMSMGESPASSNPASPGLSWPDHAFWPGCCRP
jgi:hypothetical protein